jgi:hypothetical protein
MLPKVLYYVNGGFFRFYITVTTISREVFLARNIFI